MASIEVIQGTPGISSSSVIFTSGSTIEIDAPADVVFRAIIDHHNYGKWNTWTSELTFEDEGQIQKGSRGILTANMVQQNRVYKIPIEIIEYLDTPGRKVLAWRASLMPAWFAVAERVQVVTPLSGATGCQVKQWESTAGWGGYILKYLMGVPQQLKDTNIQYVTELKKYVEGSKGDPSPDPGRM